MSDLLIKSQNKISGQGKKAAAVSAIKSASDKTGMDFNYLLKTAERESALKVDAKAKTSSATGLFQFVRQTWYETLSKHGEKHGLGDYSKAIKQDVNGRYFVPNKAAKNAILNLRKEPKAASLMAAEFTKDNQSFLKSKIGRDPNAAELYMAHFMGAGSAAKLIELNGRAPDIRADQVFPKHAKSNKPIFYYKGAARSIGAVYNNLSKHHEKLAVQAGLDPKKVEDVQKLVPFLPNGDGFFGSLFSDQTIDQEGSLAYSGIGAKSNLNGAANSLLFTQVEGQRNLPTKNYQEAIPLPEFSSKTNNASSIAGMNNAFSLSR